ncbi:hypothetical protein FHX08_003660 [Rhizobium sp. BK529]|nr:hypothetical protein [Rhizobium sp. BK529]TCS03056.1 hypothetical protein EV281_104136 [Rhizobium sp. BK418]
MTAIVQTVKKLDLEHLKVSPEQIRTCPCRTKY